MAASASSYRAIRNRTTVGALLACGLALVVVAPLSAETRTLKVSENRRFLVDSDGKPFFYLGDTAWELFHRLTREEADHYLRNRAEKGFTVIQAVALAEFDGVTAPNAYGHLPLVDNDPRRPAVQDGPENDYWDHVDYVVDRAEALGLFVGLLPTWRDKWNKKWGTGPELFTPETAETYGRWIGSRYAAKPIIWILGGDRPVENDQHREVIRSLARGIQAGDGGRGLITFHPTGGQSSSAAFHDDPWLAFNMRQNGHVAEFTGRYDLLLAGQLEGKPWTLALPGGARPLALKQYTRVEGMVELPAGAIVKSVQARVLDPKGAVRASQILKL